MFCGDGDKILVNDKEIMEFMMSSEQVFMPEGDLEKRKVINRNFRNSCMLVKIAEKGYMIGRLNWTDATQYSMNVMGKDMKFSYAKTEAIFKPHLC